MSYVFSQINSALKGEEDPKKVSTNIFAPEESQGTNVQGGGDQPQAKTNTEGTIGSSGQGSGTASSEAKPASQAPAQSQTADARLMQRNKVKAAPGFATRAQDEIGAAEAGLQDEANKYVQTASAQNYGVANEDLDKAIGGDEAAATSARNLFSGSAGQAESFVPKTDYNIEDINDMQTDAGVENILRRESGPQYSSGEAAFDRSLLGRSNEFNQLRSLLKGKQDSLSKMADEYSGPEGKRKEVQKTLDDRYKTAQDTARGYLETKDDEVLAAIQKRAAEENAARAALREAGGGQYLTEQQSQSLKELADANPELAAEIMKGGGITARDYYSTGADIADSRDIATDAEFKRYSAILGLLGRGSGDLAGAGIGAGDRESFKGQDYKDAVMKSIMSSREKAALEAQQVEQQAAIEAQRMQEERAAQAAAAEQARLAEAARKAEEADRAQKSAQVKAAPGTAQSMMSNPYLDSIPGKASATANNVGNASRGLLGQPLFSMGPPEKPKETIGEQIKRLQAEGKISSGGKSAYKKAGKYISDRTGLGKKAEYSTSN
jgi:hypothetical protein